MTRMLVENLLRYCPRPHVLVKLPTVVTRGKNRQRIKGARIHILRPPLVDRSHHLRVIDLPLVFFHARVNPSMHGSHVSLLPGGWRYGQAFFRSRPELTECRVARLKIFPAPQWLFVGHRFPPIGQIKVRI